MTQAGLSELVASSARGLELELNNLLPVGSPGVGEHVQRWFSDAVDSLASEFTREFPADGLSAKGLRDPAGGPFGPPGSPWCSLFVLGGGAGKRQSKSLRPWTARNWTQFLAKTSELSIEMAAKFSTLNRFGHAGVPSLTISASRHRKLSDWVTLSPVYVVGDMRFPEIPDRVADSWQRFLHRYAVRSPPAFGYLADDSIAAGSTRTPLEARTQTFPATTLPQVDSVLRGYSWITVASARIAELAGGIDALRAGGAFAEVTELSSGGVILQATSSISEYQRDAVRRVFEVLGPAMPKRLPTPDPLAPFFKLIYELPQG